MRGARGWRRSGWVIAALLTVGVALRAFAYFSNVSLWLDEMLVGRNILDAPLSTLAAKPLALDQVAPRGFLLVERASVTVFGRNELALRLFPLLCSLATLLLFWRVARRALNDAAATVAIALVAIGVPFIHYGVVVKQYAADAAATAGLLLLAFHLRDRDWPTSRLVAAGAVGPVVIWFSQGSAMVMAGLGLAFAIEWLSTRDQRMARVLLRTVPLWAVGTLMAVIAGKSSMSPAMQQFMDDFWATGFVPLPFALSSSATWLWERVVNFFLDPALLRYRWPAVYAVLTIAGMAVLARERRRTAWLLAGPVLAYLGAAIGQQYPFRGRLVFGLLPIVILAVAAGVEWLANLGARLHSAVSAIVIAACLVAPVRALAEAPPPYDLEHHRTILAYLQSHRQPGDVIYVFPLQRIGTDFYGPRFGLQPDEWVIARCSRDDTRHYVRDVDRFRGQPRVWVLSAGVRPYRTARAAVRDYLGAIGIKRDALVLPSLTLTTVSLELFDLSDPGRLAQASAESFPVEPMPNDPRPGCRPWLRADFKVTFD